MQDSVTKKTVSARKRNALLVAAFLVLFVALGISLFSLTRTTGDANTVILQTNSKRYTLTLAVTPQAQQLGLGKRSSLSKNQGMLFVFQQPAVQCFWMKDMHFPLDMIWLSAARRVEYIKTNVSPATYPNTFCPDVQATYVIELNAGQAAAARIHSGETLSF